MNNGIETRNEILAKIDALEDLPTLPVIAQQVIALTMDPNANFDKFSNLILSDPPLAARVMKTANSVYYGRLEPAKNIRDAIFTIGLDDLASICASIGVIESFSHWEQQNLDQRSLWKHSISSAAVAERIIKHEDIYGAINFFLAGLLHDIGWMILDHVVPAAVEKIISIIKDDDSWSFEKETELLGVNHAEIGAIVLGRWKIAEELIALTKWHHSPENAEGLASHACLLQIASDLAPFDLPFDPPLSQISPHVPLEISTLDGKVGMAELKERYEKHINHATKFTEMSLGWL